MNYETIKTLAKQTSRRVQDLIALAPQNDPFYMGTPTDNAMASWFADVYTRAGFGVFRAPHLRRVHYWTVSQEPPVLMHNGLPYENTQKCWEYLQNASKVARYLDLVPLHGIVDNKNPQPHVNAIYSPYEPTYEIATPQLDNPDVMIYNLMTANAQPYHLEIWCEKSTMNDVLLPICQQYGANLVTFEGEVSITSVCVDFMRRVKDAGNKPVRVFYISDFDPAGNSMPVAMSRKIEFMTRGAACEYDIKVKPIALTADQIAAYKLPRMPIKETERRAASFESAFGAGATELDALEALYPGVFGQIVTSAIEPYYSTAAAAAVRDARDNLRQAVTAQIDAITARYSVEIEALRGMIAELSQISVDAAAYEVGQFAPHVDESGDAWLFDSDRDYIGQLMAYRVHKGKDETI